MQLVGVPKSICLSAFAIPLHIRAQAGKARTANPFLQQCTCADREHADTRREQSVILHSFPPQSVGKLMCWVLRRLYSLRKRNHPPV